MIGSRQIQPLSDYFSPYFHRIVYACDSAQAVWTLQRGRTQWPPGEGAMASPPAFFCTRLGLPKILSKWRRFLPIVVADVYAIGPKIVRDKRRLGPRRWRASTNSRRDYRAIAESHHKGATKANGESLFLDETGRHG